MGVARETVAAPKLAAPIRVNGPPERHTRFGAVKNGAGGNLEVADLRLGIQQSALRGEASNAGQHASIFAFYSPLGKVPG